MSAIKLKIGIIATVIFTTVAGFFVLTEINTHSESYGEITVNQANGTPVRTTRTHDTSRGNLFRRTTHTEIHE